ncbi:RimK family alpha-L-glutamate ligase [Streptomyces sp. NPDC058295]|uniref:ATP-grasp domain-containing protein n=1 Tax=Streptomyces sp. NPDC058295 TaxID=3346431 RepID=UPI0036E964A7
MPEQGRPDGRQREIVFLCDEPDAQDLRLLRAEISNLGATSEQFHPDAMTISSAAGRAQVWCEDQPHTASVLIGWVRGEARAAAMAKFWALEQLGLDVVNGWSSMLMAANPFYRSVLLHASELPHPPLFSGRESEAALSLAARVGYPVAAHPLVLLPCHGHNHRGSVLFEDETSLRSFLTHQVATEHFYVHAHRGGRTLRVTCVGGIPVLSSYDHVSWGACGLPAPGPVALETLPSEAAALAAQASAVVGHEFTSVHLAEDDLAPGGYWVLDAVPYPALDSTSWPTPTVASVLGHLAAALSRRAHQGCAGGSA